MREFNGYMKKLLFLCVLILLSCSSFHLSFVLDKEIIKAVSHDIIFEGSGAVCIPHNG